MQSVNMRDLQLPEVARDTAQFAARASTSTYINQEPNFVTVLAGTSANGKIGPSLRIHGKMRGNGTPDRQQVTVRAAHSLRQLLT
jgi:hypothetical protein